MDIFLLLFAALILFYALKRYLGVLISFSLTRYFRCESVKLHGCGLFFIKHIKFVFHSGISVELESLRLSSSFLNQEHSKPISITLDDIRVESQSSLYDLDRKVFHWRKKATPANETYREANNLFQFLQYTGARINCANIVLLEAIPDCLLHISLENVQLETYRYKEGLQAELSFKLAQAKLFVRNHQRAVCLAELSLAGSLAVDTSETRFDVRRLRVTLNNPRFSFFDYIFDYLSTHRFELSTQPRPGDSKSALDDNQRNTSATTAFNALSRLPDLKLEIDAIVVQFVAEPTRTLSMTIGKTDVEFANSEQRIATQFREIVVASASYLKCTQIVVTTAYSANAPITYCQLECCVSDPTLALNQLDIVWWIDYVRRLDLTACFSLANNTSNSTVDDAERFADDFSRDFVLCQIEEALKQQQYGGASNSSPTRLSTNGIAFQLAVKSELSNFQGQLKGQDGAAIGFGIELATFSSDNNFEQFELGVESLWCHRATDANADFKFDFSRHRWGTTSAIGAGLMDMSRNNAGVCQLLIQLDECRFEWEESVILQLVGFVDLFYQTRNSATSAAKKPSKSAAKQHQISRDDSWSSIPDSQCSASETLASGGLIFKLSAKRLSVFLTARQSVFVVVSVNNWRVEANASNGVYATTLDGLHIGESEMRRFKHFDDVWWQAGSANIRCGGVQKLSARYLRDGNELMLYDISSADIIWSISAHLVLYETYCTARQALDVLRVHFGVSDTSSCRSSASPSRPLLVNAFSDVPVEIGFRLPRDHYMRWVVPSLRFEKADNFWTLYAPTFCIEMDGHIVLNVERPAIRVSPGDIAMNLNRQEFKHLIDKTNRVWTWSANSFELHFPYGYNFSDAYEEVINAVKWVKMVHCFKSQPFRDDGRLPADVRILLKKVSLQLNDDPFEIRLQNIYEVMMDEVFERERRRQILEMKISQLKKDDPLFPKVKLDALYNSLMKKDAQIYVERIRKVQQQQPERCLLLWVWYDVDTRIYADSSYNTAPDVVRQIRRLNAESALPDDAATFSTLWARAVELDVAEATINFRDYPLAYVIMRDAHFWGTLVGAEQLTGERSIRQQFIDAPAPWGRYIIKRNMCPLKFYYDLACEIDELNSTYGPCWEPCLTMISLCWNLVNAPSKDPSDPLPFWDKVRLLLHGQFSMLCKRLVTSMLASTDPYNDTELVELSWNNFEFDWTSGEFRVQTDVDAFIRTASKYDDSRLFHLPRCKFAVQLDWDCLGDQYDHHSIVPCAPNKLPDYSTNIVNQVASCSESFQKHDSFRAFRSNSVSAIMRFEVKPPNEGQCPQILLYANTFRCLEFMKNTLTTVYRPVRRGALFNAQTSVRRVSLSAHLKCMNLSVSLPRFLISYWMSFSSPFGFRMVSDSLNLTMAAVLRISPVDKNDGISRRPRSSWKVSHMSAQLEKAEIHLYGEKRQPTVGERNVADADDAGDGGDDTPESFFIGLSRLNYIRECNPTTRANASTKVSPRLNVPPTSAVGGCVNGGGGGGGGGNGGGGNTADEKNVVHRLIAHDLKASWTTENRDICLVIAEGVQRAHILRKILDNEAMKVFKFNHDTNQYGQKASFTTSPPMTERHECYSATNNDNNAGSNATALASGSPPDDGEEMLRKLVDEAGTNLVAYSEETVENPTNSLHGVALCASDGVRLTNWQIDLLNSQLVLRGCARAGDFVLVTAARASVTQRFYYPIWRHAQLLLKRSWCAVLSGMQYFAPVVVGLGAANGAEFRWLSREIIEEKPLADPSVSDKVNNYSSTGEAVGGVVADPFLKNRSASLGGSADATDGVPICPELQLQRVASRCSCQLFFCYFSDTINMEKTEEEDICIPTMNQSSAAPDNGASTSWQGSNEHKHRFEEVDCFTLKHNMLEVSTNADQYQMIIDIVNSLILFVDPKKTRAEENRRRLWFRLSKTTKRYVKEQIVNMQSELREVVSIVRSLERQSYFLNKELLSAPGDPSLCSTNEQIKSEIDEYKARQNALVDDLATMISCYKEKEVEEAAEAHRLRLVHEHIQRRNGADAAPDADDESFDAPQAPTARRFEVCFEDCIWRLTESDGQISLAEMQIRNFLYTRTARIDNSGDHLLEIGVVKVLNLLPNSKYKETLARLPVDASAASTAGESNMSSTDRTPSIRVICRELPPVGGICIKEHFEVNIAPMNAQMTYRFFEKMMAFFFPGRNIDKEDQQNLDVADDQQSQQGFSLARKLRGAVNHSFRTAAASSTATTSGPAMAVDASPSLGSPVNDEIDKMKERAKKNNMFLYIIIPPVPFVVSYKGNKEKNIEDVDRFDITFPIFEYHDRNWTWLDLALAIKQRCRRIILPQLLRQKLLRKRIIGVERASLPNIETVDEGEKRRIVLGVETSDDKTRKRKS